MSNEGRYNSWVHGSYPEMPSSFNTTYTPHTAGSDDVKPHVSGLQGMPPFQYGTCL